MADETIVRTWEGGMRLSAEVINDPTARGEIVRRFEQLLDGFNLRHEAVPGVEVRLWVDVPEARQRPIIGHEGQVLVEGDPGVEPWEATDG